MKITIVGAGMAGLVAANILRRHQVVVLERAPELPRNHTAVLRFRSLATSDATGVPFSRGVVRKGLWDGERVINEPTLAHLNAYSAIVTAGELHDRSIFNLRSEERWLAPVDFVEQMARCVDIKFEVSCDLSAMSQKGKPIIISTIPMPFAMDQFGWRDKPEFKYLPVWTLKAQLLQPITTVCQTLYQTNESDWYRATIHNQELTLEYMFDPTPLGSQFPVNLALEKFGYTKGLFNRMVVNKIAIGKILPINEAVRKRFMLWMTEKHNVYSLGRFATWRNILLDDVVSDVKTIEAMIEKETTYEQRKKVTV